MRKNYSSSSIFALKGNDLDKRYDERNRKYDKALNDIKSSMKDILKQYVDGDIVTSRSLEEYLIRELLLDYREREGC